MRLLLDTHVLVWSMLTPDRIPSRVRELLRDPDNERLWSVASTLELAIKVGIGRLRLGVPLASFVKQALWDLVVTPLAIDEAHAFRVAELPLHHRDPMDRLLVAQAQLEGLTIVSVDRLIARYEVEVLW